MKYLLFDSSDRLIKRFDDAIHAIPAGAIAVSEQQFLETLRSGGEFVRDQATGEISFHPFPDQSFSAQINELLLAVDLISDKTRARIVGDSSRAVEYEVVAREAMAYRGADYLGEVPPLIDCWAKIQGWTAQQAAENIIDKSEQCRSVIQAIRDVRLRGKAAIRQAADLISARDAFNDTILKIQKMHADA